MHDLLERRWAVDERCALPSLDDILHDVVADGEVQRDTLDVTKVYYDTPGHDLQAQGVALYCRDGDGETGWRLEIPTDGGRDELQWIPSDDPPTEAVSLLTGLTGGNGIVDVAKIHTTRERYRIRTGKRPCLQVDDDRVRASVGERLLAWREIEVRPAPDAESSEKSAKRLTKRPRAAGAQPLRCPSKLARVSPPAPPVNPRTPATRALVDHLNAQIDQIVAGDIGLRRGRDPIHDTRVATRRLRSTLRVFGKLVDQSANADMDSELKWFAGLLGDVRDCEVQQSRFTKALDGPDGIADELILGPVKTRIRNDLDAVGLPARCGVSDAMESARYLAIMAVLRRWRVEPPVCDVSTRTLLRRARRAQRKADRRLTAALRTGDPAEDAMLHRARKAAKRARYAAELCKPVDKPKRTKRIIKHYKHIQSLLGEHQDAVVATAALRKMAIAAGTTPGENGFTYGVLYAREQQIARRCRQEARNLL
jgi:CHAD domain-containing protein